MTKLSLWAKHHPETARFIIVLLHILLVVLAVYTGITLLQVGVSLPIILVYTTILLFFTAIFFYPSRNKKKTRFNKRQLYSIRKLCDFILATCSFTMVCFVTNNYSNNNTSITSFTIEAAAFSKGGEKPTAEAILASLAYRDKSTLTRSEKEY